MKRFGVPVDPSALRIVRPDPRWVAVTLAASLSATTLQGVAVATIRSSDAASLRVVLGTLMASYALDFGARAAGAQLLHASGSRIARRLLGELDLLLVQSDLTDDLRVPRATRLLSVASIAAARMSQSLLLGVLGAIRAVGVLASALGPVGPASLLRAGAVVALVGLLTVVRLRGVARIQGRHRRTQARVARQSDRGDERPLDALPRVAAATGAIRSRLLLQHRSAAETRLTVVAMLALLAIVGGGSSADVGAAVAGALIAANAFAAAVRTTVGLGRFLPTVRAAGRLIAAARGGAVESALTLAASAPTREVGDDDDE